MVITVTATGAVRVPADDIAAVSEAVLAGRLLHPGRLTALTADSRPPADPARHD